MKTVKQFPSLLVLMLMLSACGPATATATPAGAALNPIYTAAALTLAAQAAAVSPTPKPAATVTPLASPTLIPTVAAPQNVSAPAAMVNAGASCDNSAYLGDVTIPDGTIFAPGKSFTKTWSFQNTGTCVWSTSYSLVFVSGSVLGGSTTALSAAVSSGGQTNASVTLVAPSTAGIYTGYWRLQNSVGMPFGQSVYVQIIVSETVETATPTGTEDISVSTSTPTSTSAPTSLPTEVPTSTSVPTTVPTETPTSVPEPTSTSVQTDSLSDSAELPTD